MRKKLMIAGDSFSAPSQRFPGTVWGDVLAKKLDWDVVNLARQGCSNGGIRIQVEEIRRQKPDFAVVSATFWDRIEIPAKAAPYDWSTPPGHWDPPLQRHLQNRELKNGYDREDGINNINYGNNNYNMICETIFSLAENYPHPYRSGKIDRDTQLAIRNYIDCIYDNAWKKQQDEWIFVEGVLQMYLDGLNFLVLPNLLWPFDNINHTLWRDAFPSIIPDRYIQMDSSQSPQAICGNNPFEGEDPGYHGNEESQRIIAENWYNRIKNDFNLV